MKLQCDVIFKRKRVKLYPFDEMRPGASFHLLTKVERGRAVTAFCAWRKRTRNNHLICRSAQVDETDPSGVGYRFWLLNKEVLLDGEEI